MRRPSHLASVAVATTVMLTAACASSGATSGGSSSGSGIPSSVQSRFDKASGKGSYTEPQTSTKTTAGKKITAIVYGNQSVASPIYADALKAAAKVAGWDVNVVDGKFSSSAQVSAIQQAVAEKVDGIVLYVIDCSTVKAAVQQAKAAQIPVVYGVGSDCGATGSTNATGYSLGDYRDIAGKSVDYNTYVNAAGAIQADAAIVAKKGGVNALAINFLESTATQAQTDGFVQELKQCKSCTSKTLDLRFADFGSSLQAKVSTALLQNPKINTIFGNYDDPVVNGIVQAVQASNRRDIYITGEGAYPAMLTAIEQDKAQMTVGYDVALEGWATVERFNRIFHGDTGPFNLGLGIQSVTKDHNLPPAGKQYVAPIDYKAVFTKAWTN